MSRSIREGYKFGHLNYYTVPSLLFLLDTVGLVSSTPCDDIFVTIGEAFVWGPSSEPSKARSAEAL